MVSKLAKNKDAAHQRRIKKINPKQRFKALSKADQYIVTARALADILKQKREEKGQRHVWSGCHVTVNQLKANLIEIDPATGVLKQSSVMKIKRAMADAIKRTLGPDAAFMMVVEDRDKLGAPVEPHVHIIAMKHFRLGGMQNLRKALYKVAEKSDEKTVKVNDLSPVTGYKRHLERVRDEADFRRTAGYNTKNEDSRFYRSKIVLEHVPETWEALTAHYLKP